MSLGTRRRGREAALSVLFHLDLNPTEAGQALADAFACFPEALDVEARSRAFAAELVDGVVEHRDVLDQTIEECATNWRIDRMGRVDRNVLRMAAYELVVRADVPVRVVLDEAIELAKRYGTADSGAFVNGVLDRLARSHAAPRASDDGESGDP